MRPTAMRPTKVAVAHTSGGAVPPLGCLDRRPSRIEGRGRPIRGRGHTKVAATA